jgi:transposase, IS5 family
MCRQVSRQEREENEAIKAGKIPQRFKANPNMQRQKDADARWIKKNDETHYGYKNHIAVDNAHKLIRNYEVTSAEVHDSQVFEEILADNTSQDVWADSAYRSEEIQMSLSAMEYRSHIHKKGTKTKPLTEKEKQANKKNPVFESESSMYLAQ